MNIRTKALVAAFLTGWGMLAPIAPASATIIDLLRENFNDIAVPAGGQVNLADVDPALLPAGIEFEGSTNVRGVDNVINTSGGSNGFHNHFTSNFLVLGDDTGQIGGSPTTDISRIRIPFVIPGNATRISISYRDAFNGTDTNPARVDEFLVRMNGEGPAEEIELLQSPGDFDGHTGIAAIFDVFDDADPFTISPGTYHLVFRLSESGGGDTNTAAGLDRIRVRAEIPAPGSFLLLASGLAGLAGWGRRQSRQPLPR